MPRLRQARGDKIRVPERPEHEPLPPPQVGHPGAFFDWPPCFFVPPEQLAILGFGPPLVDRLPTLVLVEETEVSGQKDRSRVVYSIAPRLARIDYPDGSVVLDEIMRQVAYYDAEDGGWKVESLEDCEARVDSNAAWRREYARPAAPIFTPRGGTTIVTGYQCQPYRLNMSIAWPDGSGEEITQEIWVTRDIETTEEIYATYRHALRLFDNHWQDVPADRPAGIVFRSREVRLPTPRQAGERVIIEDATLVEVGYRLYPIDFFAPQLAGGVPHPHNGNR